MRVCVWVRFARLDGFYGYRNVCRKRMRISGTNRCSRCWEWKVRHTSFSIFLSLQWRCFIFLIFQIIAMVMFYFSHFPNHCNGDVYFSHIPYHCNGDVYFSHIPNHFAMVMFIFLIFPIILQWWCLFFSYSQSLQWWCLLCLPHICLTKVGLRSQL